MDKQKVEVKITKVLDEKGVCFGVRTDLNESVFFPVKAYRHINPKSGLLVMAVCLPNEFDKSGRTPWFAAWARRSGDKEGGNIDKRNRRRA